MKRSARLHHGRHQITQTKGGLDSPEVPTSGRPETAGNVASGETEESRQQEEGLLGSCWASTHEQGAAVWGVGTGAKTDSATPPTPWQGQSGWAAFRGHHTVPRTVQGSRSHCLHRMSRSLCEWYSLLQEDCAGLMGGRGDPAAQSGHGWDPGDRGRCSQAVVGGRALWPRASFCPHRTKHLHGSVSHGQHSPGPRPPGPHCPHWLGTGRVCKVIHGV